MPRKRIDNPTTPSDINPAISAPQKGHPMPRSITIQGHTFPVEDAYAEGHVVTANEAGALNQTRAENLRNNFAGKVKAAGETPDWDALEKEFSALASAYVFGARGGGVRTSDPVAREAKRLATEAVEKAIRAKHGKLDAVSKENRAQLIEGLAAREDYVAQAKANIESAAALGADLGL